MHDCEAYVIADTDDKIRPKMLH